MLAIVTTVCTSFTVIPKDSKLMPHHSSALFLTFVPTPLALLTDSDGTQNVHIAPEAFNVSSAAFGSEIRTWEEVLPEGVTLESVTVHLTISNRSTPTLIGCFFQLSGARVVKINGQDPFVAVNTNAQITGSFQGFGTRQSRYAASQW